MILRVAECTGVVYCELVAEQVSKFFPSSSLEDGRSTKVGPNVVLIVLSRRVLVTVNSGHGRLWPVHVKLVEEPLKTGVVAWCSVILVGGSVRRECNLI